MLVLYDVGDLILLLNRPGCGMMVRGGLVEIVVIGLKVFSAECRKKGTVDHYRNEIG